MGKLDGKITIVTGATSGIGRRTVEIFVEEGARVVATVGSAAKAKIAARVGADAVIRYDEITEPAALAAAIRAALSAH